MTIEQKRKFLFGGLLWLLAIVGLPTAMLLFLAENNPEDSTFALVLVGGILALGIVLLCVFYLICWVDIRRSKKRYANRLATQN